MEQHGVGMAYHRKLFKMKNMREIINQFEEVGIPFKYLINGLVGGFIWSVYQKSKFIDGLRQTIIGGTVSAYTTPLIIEQSSLGPGFIGFTCFVVGLLGMVIIDSIYKWGVSFLKKRALVSALISNVFKVEKNVSDALNEEDEVKEKK